MPVASEISLFDVLSKTKAFLRHLLSKWLIILTVFLIGGTLGFIYGWLQKPKYLAQLTFATEDERSSGGIAGIAAQFGVDIGGSTSGTFSGNNIIVLLRSNKIAENTLLSTINVNGRQTSLLNLFLEISELKKAFAKAKNEELRNLSFPEGQSPTTYSRLQDSVLMAVITNINKNIVIINKPDEKLNLYSINCNSENEVFSQAYATHLIAEGSKFYISLKTKKSAQVVEILQKRADSLKKVYVSALASRAELSDANLNPAFQLPTIGIQTKQTDLTVFGTAYGELVKNLELAKFNLLRETPVIQVVDEPVLPLKRKRLGRLFGAILGSFILSFLFVGYLAVKKMFTQPKKLND